MCVCVSVCMRVCKMELHPAMLVIKLVLSYVHVFVCTWEYVHVHMERSMQF